MPLNSKGKKIKAAMEKQYGKKKGQSVFYAMENSGKLRNVVKAKGGMDASKGDYGKEATARDAGMGMSGKVGFDSGVKGPGNNGGNVGGKNVPPVTVRKGPMQVPAIGPLAVGFNALSTSLYNQKNLVDARKNDLLGGEMLTTGQKNTGTAEGEGSSIPKPTGGCADGSSPPCKAPEVYKPAAKPRNNFLSGFRSYDDGGEVVISSNVDKDLL